MQNLLLHPLVSGNGPLTLTHDQLLPGFLVIQQICSGLILISTYLQLLLVTGMNRTLGVSDEWFCAGDSLVLTVLAQNLIKLLHFLCFKPMLLGSILRCHSLKTTSKIVLVQGEELRKAIGAASYIECMSKTHQGWFKFKCMIQQRNNSSKADNNNDTDSSASTAPGGGSASALVIPSALCIPTREMLLNKLRSSLLANLQRCVQCAVGYNLIWSKNIEF